MRKSAFRPTATNSVLALTVIAFLALAQPHAGYASEAHNFDITAANASQAIRELANQSGLQILVSWDVLEGKKLNPVTGSHSTEEALQLLLANSGLTHKYVGDRGVAIVKTEEEKKVAAGKPTAEVREERGIRIAQAGATTEGSGTEVEQQAAARDENGKEEEGVQLKEIVVTGTHIRGSGNPSVPMKILDRHYIESTGISTVTRLIESLPQNYALTSQSGVYVPGITQSELQGSSINLRGIGEGTTLVLVNGRRLAPGFMGSAVDISALPLSAVDRVEVLTDGASAIYGSDAVGGVVNFVLRDDYDGAQTDLRGAYADGGVHEYRASHVLGRSWAGGNAVISGEFYQRDPLMARDRGFVPPTSELRSLLPRDENHAALLSGKQKIGNQLTTFVDALYTNRDSYNESLSSFFEDNYFSDTSQYSATVGLSWLPAGDWRIETSGTVARNRLSAQMNEFGAPNLQEKDQFDLAEVQLKGDGSVLSLPAGSVRGAIGIDWRHETLEIRTHSLPSETLLIRDKQDQSVRSIFAELHIPIVGNASARGGVRSLELTAAGRYDDYSSFGSSVDPQFGFMWQPIEVLRVRGNFGTSYVAPKLADQSAINNNVVAYYSDDTGAGRVTHQLWVLGSTFDDFVPQESESFTLGMEFAPASASRPQASLNYYHITYRNRIQNASAAAMLMNLPGYQSLYIRSPSADQVAQCIAIGELGGHPFTAYDPAFNPDTSFDPSSVDVALDYRRRNLSVVETSGLDLSLTYPLAALGGAMALSIDTTYIFERNERVTRSSAPFETVDTFYNPPDWRVRAAVNWQRAGWSANAFVNYTDTYTDNRSSPLLSVASYVTVDARLEYAFGETAGWLAGAAVSANVQNLFDKDPPSVAMLNPLGEAGFDPTNANPMGRLTAVELSKKW